jgi:hypothetical protein
MVHSRDPVRVRALRSSRVESTILEYMRTSCVQEWARRGEDRQRRRVSKRRKTNRTGTDKQYARKQTSGGSIVIITRLGVLRVRTDCCTFIRSRCTCTGWLFERGNTCLCFGSQRFPSSGFTWKLCVSYRLDYCCRASFLLFGRAVRAVFDPSLLPFHMPRDIRKCSPERPFR